MHVGCKREGRERNTNTKTETERGGREREGERVYANTRVRLFTSTHLPSHINCYKQVPCENTNDPPIHVVVEDNTFREAVVRINDTDSLKADLLTNISPGSTTSHAHGNAHEIKCLGPE